MTRVELARPFPQPGTEVRFYLDDLHRFAGISSPSERELKLVETMPRPWDPASCEPDFRRLLYKWLDEVVAWINEDHSWRVDRVVPGCWVEHPHIVHELATVACVRWSAQFATTAVPLADWYRFTLPVFLDRIAQQIGPTGCPPGRHQPHPGASRNDLYRDGVAQAERHRRQARDASAVQGSS